MKAFVKFLILTFFLMSISVMAFGDEEVRNVEKWNLKDGLAIQGYDPVAYFPEADGKAVKGLVELKFTLGGVTYHFSSKENKDLFIGNPSKYEPAHGGWCSTAMTNGSKLKINPLKFIVKTDKNGNAKRLFLFSLINGKDAKKMWEKKAAKMERKADKKWKSKSGEAPRGLK